MNTQDVIETISRATNDLFATLRQQDEAIRGFETTVQRLEQRINNLESMLADSRQAHNTTMEDAAKLVADLRAQLSTMTTERDTAVTAQNKLKDVILNVAAGIDHVVNPKEMTQPSVNPFEGHEPAPKPSVLFDEKGFPHDPVTGKFVEPPAEVKEDYRPLREAFGY